MPAITSVAPPQGAPVFAPNLGDPDFTRKATAALLSGTIDEERFHALMAENQAHLLESARPTPKARKNVLRVGKATVSIGAKGGLVIRGVTQAAPGKTQGPPVNLKVGDLVALLAIVAHLPAYLREQMGRTIDDSAKSTTLALNPEWFEGSDKPRYITAPGNHPRQGESAIDWQGASPEHVLDALEERVGKAE